MTRAPGRRTPYPVTLVFHGATTVDDRLARANRVANITAITGLPLYFSPTKHLIASMLASSLLPPKYIASDVSAPDDR
jgi:hypothetical protein